MQNPIPAELRPEQVVVAIDAREQLPWNLAPLQTVVQSGQTGDYRLRDCPTAICLERKSISDFVSCCGSERQRFEAELERLAAFPARAVIVEASWADLERGEWRSQIKPQAVVASALGWICQGIPIVLAGDRSTAERYAAKMLFIVARRRWRENRSLLAGALDEAQAAGIKPQGNPPALV